MDSLLNTNQSMESSNVPLNQEDKEHSNSSLNSSNDNTLNIISKEKELSDFFEKFPDLQPFVKFSECHIEGLEKFKFRQNLNNTHTVIINDINALIKQLNKEISTATNKIYINSSSNNHDEIKQKINQTIQVKNFNFDDTKNIFIVRQLVFVQRKIKMKEIKIINSHVQIFKETKAQMERMKSIFNLHCLHQIKIQLDHEFFDINLRASKDQNLKKNLKRLESLRRFEKSLIQTIEKLPRAKWSGTHNDFKKKFSHFMDELVQQAFILMDWEISYCEPLDIEVSLSRCLFNPFSEFKQGIDKYIESIFLNEPSANFVQKLISFCFVFLDEYLGLKKKKVEYQSTALVIIFRSFFNRCYERFSSYFANRFYSCNQDQNENKLDLQADKAPKPELNYSTSGNFMETLQISTAKKNKILNKIEKMKSVPAKNIPLPPALIQNRSQNARIAAEVAERLKIYTSTHPKLNDNSNLDNSSQNNSDTNFTPIHGYDVTHDETPIRDLFLSDPMFSQAAESFNLSIFCSNPLDSLFKINKALSFIHKGALNNQTENTSKYLSIARTNAILEGNFDFKEDELNLAQNRSDDNMGECKDDLKQLLSFDDLFSLFFGTLLASDIPDLFDLAAFVGKFAPKVCLSPPFEYAQANIEALVLHCINLDKDDHEQE